MPSLPLLLSAAVGVPTVAAITVGGNSVAPFYVLAGVALMLAVFGHREPQADLPGRGALLGFTAVALTVTAVGPALFAEVLVLPPREGIESVLAPQTLTYSISNAAQAIYLMLGVGVVFYLARQDLPRHLLAVGLGLGVALSSLRWLVETAGGTWPAAIFESSVNVDYVNSNFYGTDRLRGVFAEPSELATFMVMAVAYFLSAAHHTAGRRRVLFFGLAACAGFNLAMSYSGTGVVAAGVMAGLAALVALRRWWRTGWVNLGWLTVAGIGVYAAVLYGPAAYRAVAGIIEEKVGSFSYSARGDSNEFSVSLLWESFGVGVGLGSNRPSSFAALLLSCTGAAGAVLFVVAVAAIGRRAWATTSGRPAVWALAGLLVAKVVAAPDLASPALWVALGVCANAAWRTVPQAAELVRTRHVQS